MIEETMEKEKTRPIHQVTMPFSGAVLKAAIWRHQEGESHPRFTVTLSRGYRSEKDGKWVFTDFFNRDEILGLSRVLEMSHAFIIANEAEKGGTENE